MIDVLSKSYKSPVKYEIGFRGEDKSKSDYEIGINKEIKYQLEYEILALPETPIIVDGKYNKGIRLEQSDIKIDISNYNEWTVSLYRRGVKDFNFHQYFFLSDGRVYVDKELINTNISWFEFNETDKTVTIKNEAIDIDELIAMPFMITDEDLDRYYNSTFYDPDEKEKINKPDNITMKEL